MNRRDWFKLTGAAAAWSVFPSPAAMALSATGAPASGRATIDTEIKRIMLRHTWTTTMSSSDFRDVLYVRYTRDGLTGRGEGAPIIRYHEDAKSAQAAVERAADYLATVDPTAFTKAIDGLLARVEGEWAAKAAMDIALFDWLGQKRGLPVHALFGADPADAPVTTFSIGMDKPDVVREKVKEAAPYPVLKVKVGLASDEEMIASVRSATDKPLRVDANEGWKDKETAARKIEWLQTQNVEFIEQPMPAHMLEEAAWLRERVEMPIIADEACLRPADVVKLAGACDGVNIKIDKAGGLLQGYRMIQIARALGMKTMLGCMISSSVSITAAAQLSPLVDYADLDGNLLISNDPFRGVTVKDGKLVLPTEPGLGLVPA